MNGLRSHPRFSRAKDRDKDLGQTMSDKSRAVCHPLLREINGDIAQLELFPTIRTKTVIVQDFYSGTLDVSENELSMRRRGNNENHLGYSVICHDEGKRRAPCAAVLCCGYTRCGVA